MAKRKIIVFTNGCFDLLHVGHVKYLQAAAEFGDYLIVGLNSDSSFKRAKGRAPVFNQAARSAILKAIEVVDEVRIFDEDDPSSLLQELRPDIIIKGADYKPCEVKGKEFASKVICIDVGIDVHTSDIVKALTTLA